MDWINTGDNDVGATRLTVPAEAVRVASLPHWFQQTIEEVNSNSNFLFRSSNNGIPARMSTAIDLAIMNVIRMAKAKMQQCEISRQVHAGVARHFQQARVYATRVGVK